MAHPSLLGPSRRQRLAVALTLGVLLAAVPIISGPGCGGGVGPPSNTISGTLVDAANTTQPIANAYVYIPAAPPAAVGARAAPLAEFTCGPDGRFDLTAEFPEPVTIIVVPPDLSAYPQCEFTGSASDLAAAASQFPCLPAAWVSRIASIVVTPSPVTVPTGGSQQFHARVLDDASQLLPLTPWFGAVGPIGVVDDDGGLTAAGSPATGLVRATLGTVVGNASVTVSDSVPSGPRLSVSPGALDFGVSTTSLSLTVENVGSGVLEWTVAGDRPWMSVSPASGTNGGTVDVTVSRVGLPRGLYAGTIDVSSAAGNAAIAVVVTSPNQAPVIASLTATPSTLEPDASATLTVVASDADDDPLTYAWTAAGGTISGSGASVAWTPPLTEGSYDITCSVSDGHGGVTQQTVTAIVAWASGRLDVTIQ